MFVCNDLDLGDVIKEGDVVCKEGNGRARRDRGEKEFNFKLSSF